MQIPVNRSEFVVVGVGDVGNSLVDGMKNILSMKAESEESLQETLVCGR